MRAETHQQLHDEERQHQTVGRNEPRTDLRHERGVGFEADQPTGDENQAQPEPLKDDRIDQALAKSRQGRNPVGEEDARTYAPRIRAGSWARLRLLARDWISGMSRAPCAFALPNSS